LVVISSDSARLSAYRCATHPPISNSGVLRLMHFSIHTKCFRYFMYRLSRSLNCPIFI
jgi:hypothetical protein